MDKEQRVIAQFIYDAGSCFGVNCRGHAGNFNGIVCPLLTAQNSCLATIRDLSLRQITKDLLADSEPTKEWPELEEAKAVLAVATEAQKLAKLRVDAMERYLVSYNTRQSRFDIKD